MKTGVLLINLGTPDSPKTADVRKYLTQFLNDPRVIDISALGRFILVNGIIVPFRSSKSAKLYEKIWTKEAMRILKSWEVTPSIKIISKFYDHPGFIDACVEKAKMYDLKSYDYYIFSYHGLPERHIMKGAAHYGANSCKLGSCCDTITSSNQYCYRANCFETTRQLVKRLNIPEGMYESTFQSRLNDKWIKPYSDKVIERKAREGKMNILVFSPAFVADCLETIYEIGTEYEEIFKKNGGEKIQLVESLNDSPAWIAALKDMVIN